MLTFATPASHWLVIDEAVVCVDKNKDTEVHCKGAYFIDFKEFPSFMYLCTVTHYIWLKEPSFFQRGK